MKHMPFREIAQLCCRLQSSQGNDTRIQSAVIDSIRSQVLDGSTLPLVMQRLVKDGNWKLALCVIKSHHLDKAGIRRDHNIWPIMERAAPCDESRSAMRKALITLFASTCCFHRRR
ncbi:hypothetical protein, conserved [Trypanosoma brucei gambiense DAL972]|uniref:Uncharacterized protein n=1 Tax=Trypanosoma brucei gambiense (strain MHOM/CI/86/DAL972) TaxID=679716 RepID=C9ZIV9_TRYB9|nr:hypothetical protein, conserved [Trypanosoma brucei gambiense DAL972]CBH09325.1 hypothetical protein, conserved [Trypanosoma brucei gambiense DAL972]|eukprot:XP_011771633.1 hypothetical protein, conserved [Trypanosoma brucei gambiense DAL972]